MNYSRLIDEIDLHNIRIQQDGFVKLSNLIRENEILVDQELSNYIYKFRVQIPKPFNQTWVIRRRVADFQHLEKAVRHDHFLLFKLKIIHKENVQDDPKKVQCDLFNYLISLMNSSQIDRPDPEFLEFLEISEVKYGNSLKYKECFLKKQAGGRFSESKCRRCGTLWGRWDRRYFCVTQDSLMYSKGNRGDDAKVREVLPFDHNLQLYYGKVQTGHERGIILKFATRKLVLNAPDIYTFIDFLVALKLAILESPYTNLNRFNSFAPVRQSKCQWYVDGENYFGDVMEALLSAKQTVYITDWWLSPDFFLKRPIAQNEENLQNRDSRLDLVLKNIADRGVSVYILVYQEPTVALNNDSLHTKNYLEQLSRNISVMRHPYQPLIPIKWSHHEKMVVVDQNVAFMGGLDLCFGRMDNQQHRLFDEGEMQFWPGIDFANSRRKDFFNVQKTDQSLIDRNRVPRMPWHDIAIKITGDSVTDLARHFIQYWNHVIIEQNYKGKSEPQMLTNSGYEKNHQNHSNLPRMSMYIRKIEEEQSEVSSSQQLLQSTTSQNRRISNIYPEKVQVNKEILDIIKHIKVVDDEEGYMPRLPTITHNNQEKSMHHASMINFIQRASGTSGDCETQILRSASHWSIGCSQENTEYSIYLAYLQLIGEAQHFIYIENQFFITSTAGQPVENAVGRALVTRIRQAAARQEKFKVIVFVPLLPGFEGEIDDANSQVLKIQLYWEYETICRGSSSILQQLKEDPNIRDPLDYIQFYSLRTHSQGQTEMIYIHSKLMIIDDEIALIGSANINDRSLIGSRDSEIAIVVHDKNKVSSIMNGQRIGRSKFAQTLRIALYQEHFGLSYNEVLDPLSDILQLQIQDLTQRNTNIYRLLFACYPDDTVQNLRDYISFKSSGQTDKYQTYAKDIIGNAVQFPLLFMKDENLKISAFTKEYIVPDINFT